MEIEMLEQYRDLSISIEELSRVIDVHSFAPPDYSDSVIIYKEHVISILEKYKKDEVSELDVARWAKFIMFSDLYDYCKENYESTASVVAELEAPLLWDNYVDGDYGELENSWENYPLRRQRFTFKPLKTTLKSKYDS